MLNWSFVVLSFIKQHGYHQTISQENQIYHFCINKKFKRSLQDVCVKRGADAASYHHLLVGKIRMKLKKVLTMKNPRVKYNVNFLKDKTTKDQFNITLEVIFYTSY
jgi:hypothetical protein